MEEFRPFFADRLVLSLINLKRVQSKGFTKTESGAVLMSDETRKEVIVSYQDRKQEEIVHPFIGEKIHVGMLFFIQALLFSRFLRGELDAYPPFIWR
jgi:CRISPR-associated protein Cas1